MSRFALLCCGAVIALGVSNIVRADSLTLAADGKSKAVIVIGSGSEGDKTSSQIATVLSTHLKKMTGGTFDVINESVLGEVRVEKGMLNPASPPVGKDVYILLGEGALTKKCGVTSDGLGSGGIVLKTLGNVVVIMGSGAGGKDNAVYQFLETLGCRYLWPGEIGKVIPSKPTLAVPELDVRYTPVIGQRNIRFMGMGERPASGLARLQLSREDWDQGWKKANAMEPGPSWAAWQRLGGNIGIGGGHAGAGLTGGWKEHGATHPEWFALQGDGTRDQSAAEDRWRLCKSNSGLIEFVANSIIERVGKDPKLKCVSLSPNDGGYSGFCMCEECKKLDPPEAPKVKFYVFEKVGKPKFTLIDHPSLTDRMVHYWNAVAERVTKVHPDLLFLVEAYSIFSTPPVREKLHPNMVVRYVPNGIDGWEGWQKAGAKRIYWRPNILLTGRNDGKLHVRVKELADTMGFMADRGMLATDFDSIIHNWAVQGLNYYATARLNWNPHLTAEQIIDEYCSPGFGPGAGEVKKYFLTVQEVVGNPERQFTPEVLSGLRANLNAAEEAAGNDRAVCDRIRFLRLGLNFYDLQCALNRMTKLAADKNPAFDANRAKQLLELNYVMLRDIVVNHNLILNSSYLMWGNGDFSAWEQIGGRGYRPSKERIEQLNLDQGKYSLSGCENSFDEMIKSLGLERPIPTSGTIVQQSKPTSKDRTVMEADEQGRPMEMPAKK